MRIIDVERSLLQAVSAAHSGEAVWSPPDRFDMKADGIEEFIYGYVDDYRPPPYRRGAAMVVPFRLVVQCWSRHQDNFQIAKIRASALSASLGRTVVDVMDTTVSGGPRVGRARLHEAAVTDETDRVELPGFQMCLVVVPGIAEACS